MIEADGASDPRPRLGAALEQTQRQIDAIEPDDLGRSTRCAEYDVKTLLAHLVAVLRKLTVVGNGGDMTQVNDPADDHTHEWAAVFRVGRADVDRVWSADSTLDGSFMLPWGTMTGREFLDAYVHEFTVHSWDLSLITGLGSELDPQLAKAALDWYLLNVPAEARPTGGPFAPAVAVGDDADVYTRLAGFLGRPV